MEEEIVGANECCSYGLLSKDCISSSIVTNNILSSAHQVLVVPADLTLLARHIRALDLDMLIYPELGIDAIVYFALPCRAMPRLLCYALLCYCYDMLCDSSLKIHNSLLIVSKF